MKERTVLMLIMMMSIVLMSSAYGAWQDNESEKHEKDEKHKKHHGDKGTDKGKGNDKHNSKTHANIMSERSYDVSNVTGASGAGMSHKTSSSYLDTSVKANGPYVNDGTNTYKGKARGYGFNESESDGDSDSGDDNGKLKYPNHSKGGDSDSDSDSDSDKGGDHDDFSHKLKYIKKSISKLLKEAFSKWGNQGSIMAPSGMEEINPDELAVAGRLEGLSVREKMGRKMKRGARKVVQAFRGIKNAI